MFIKMCSAFCNDMNDVTVATGFPTGQYPLETRLREVEWAVSQGASEIDIVINRQLALSQDWQGMFKDLLTIGFSLHWYLLSISKTNIYLNDVHS